MKELQKQIDELRKGQNHASAIKKAFDGPGAANGGGAAAGSDSKKKRKAAAKAAAEQRQVRQPKSLEGCCTISNAATNRKRMCFAFNLGQCNQVKPGQPCSKGMHLCMKNINGEACSLAHPQSSCTR